MTFTTEFKINLQATREEDAYMKKLYEIIQEIVPSENRTKGNNIAIRYISQERANLISFEWREKNANDKNFKEYINEMQNTLKKIKWLRRHNLREITFIYD